jgi:hypothetical protein
MTADTDISESDFSGSETDVRSAFFFSFHCPVRDNVIRAMANIIANGVVLYRAMAMTAVGRLILNKWS